MKIRLAAPVAVALLVAGCAGADTGFPSLAPRAIEQRTDETPETPAAIVPADAVLKARLDALVAEARRGQAAFAEALPATERAVSAAARAEISSEAWVSAQQALSNLDTVRAPTASALGELDSLFIALADRTTTDANTGGIREAEAARAEVETLYNGQIARLAVLRGRISQP